MTQRNIPNHVQTIALVGSYVPRQCGIATFTKDLRDALADEIGPGQTTVLAMDDGVDRYAYPDEVRFQIPAQQRTDYATAAELLNINQVDAAIVQHEFGIFGGTDGSYVLDLMRRLRMPILTTLHTVLTDPTPGQRAVLFDLGRLSDRLIVMSRTAEGILQEEYGVPAERIACIPHGIPDVPFTDPVFFKDQFGWEGRTVLLTFGLLSPGKGIETVLEALPAIVENHPEVLYVVLGATHPNVLRHEGQAYRHHLERLVERRGLRDHVAFHNRYVSTEELCRYIGSADLYVTPYPNLAQISSGTLAYAAGMGKAVVSTPYWHARELLADGRGRLFEPGDAAGLAQTVNDLLEDPLALQELRKRAYLQGRGMVWKEVARQYLDLARQVVAQRVHTPRTIRPFQAQAAEASSLPDLDLAHLRRLTDDTGILQHAIYAVPDRFHGYCVDDNARALVAALMCYDLTQDRSVLPLADVYLAFLHHAFNPENRRFRNFMTFDRQWLEEAGSEDVHGRALWSLGIAVALAPNEAILSFSTRLFSRALETAETLGSPRAWAFSLVGVHAYLQRFAGDTAVRRVRDELAGRLEGLFRDNCGDSWPWCEDLVTYDNAKLAHAMILCGQSLPDEGMLARGLEVLEWLIALQLDAQGNVSLIGNQGWLGRDGQRARFDQQPIEAMALVEACGAAWRATGEEVWLRRAGWMLGWFLGANDTQSVLYDYHTGGCRDGLHADGPNLNQGAESTLAWLISLLSIMGLNRAAGLEASEAQTRSAQPAGRTASAPVP